jgi:hypothetical protein
MIPQPHLIKVYREGVKDDWGISNTEPVNQNCFVAFKTEKITNSEGTDVTVSLNITINGFFPLKYTEDVEYSIGTVTHKRKPQSIEYLSDLSGQVLYTKVMI